MARRYRRRMPKEVKVETLAYAGELPWASQGVGQEIAGGTVTGEDMIRRAGLAWLVEPRALFAHTGDGSNGAPAYAPASTHKSLVRSDRPHTVLSVVGADYGIIQNHEAMTLLDAAVGEGQAVYRWGGSLDGGRRLFVLADVVTRDPWQIEGDTIVPSVMLTSAHDGTGSCKATYLPHRPRCMNVLAAILRDIANSVCVRHTRNAQDRIRIAARVIAEARKYFGVFNAQAVAMAKVRMTEAEARQVVEVLFPAKDVDGELEVTAGVQTARDKVVALFANQRFSPIDANIAGTRWGFYNAVTAYTDHNVNRRGGDEGRFKGVLSAQTAALKSRAFELVAA